jgi:hypothetical protein
MKYGGWGVVVVDAKLKKITEDTLLPLGVVLILFGFVSWLTTLFNETRQHTDQIVEIKTELRIQNEKLDRVLEKLARIDGSLDASKGMKNVTP